MIDAAEAIVERERIDALTMRRRADELESSPMGLYRHVHDKDELLVLLLDRRAAELPRPTLPDAPSERVLVLFRLLYDGPADSPWIIEVLGQGRPRRAVRALGDGRHPRLPPRRRLSPEQAAAYPGRLRAADAADRGLVRRPGRSSASTMK